MTVLYWEIVSMTYQPIENYSMIGDLHTVALVLGSARRPG